MMFVVGYGLLALAFSAALASAARGRGRHGLDIVFLMALLAGGSTPNSRLACHPGPPARMHSTVAVWGCAARCSSPGRAGHREKGGRVSFTGRSGWSSFARGRLSRLLVRSGLRDALWIWRCGIAAEEATCSRREEAPCFRRPGTGLSLQVSFSRLGARGFSARNCSADPLPQTFRVSPSSVTTSPSARHAFFYSVAKGRAGELSRAHVRTGAGGAGERPADDVSGGRTHRRRGLTFVAVRPSPESAELMIRASNDSRLIVVRLEHERGLVGGRLRGGGACRYARGLRGVRRGSPALLGGQVLVAPIAGRRTRGASCWSCSAAGPLFPEDDSRCSRSSAARAARRSITRTSSIERARARAPAGRSPAARGRDRASG